jgi:hypothetical protein
LGNSEGINPTGTLIATTEQGEHSIKISIAEDTVKRLDARFLPEDIKASNIPEITTADNGKFLQVVDGKWAAVMLTDVSIEGA